MSSGVPEWADTCSSSSVMARLLMAVVVFCLAVTFLHTCQAECLLPDSSVFQPVACWDGQGRELELDKDYLPSYHHCLATFQSGPKGENFVLQFVCREGQWEEWDLPNPGTSVANADHVKGPGRHKRFVVTLTLLLLAGASFLIGREVSRDKSPPQLLCPTVPVTRSDPGQTSAVVRWPEPTTAYDAEEKKDMPVYRHSQQGSGSHFPEGTTEVWYSAKDSSGNEARCAVRVTVRVDRCRGPVGVEHGYVLCHPNTPRISSTGGETEEYVGGTVCKYRCHEGYRLRGPANRTCKAKDEWSDPLPVCQAVECPPLLPPPGGRYSCSGGWGFQSACSLSCLPGFAPRAAGPSVLVCGPQGAWRGATPQCADAEPPRFEQCQVLQTIIADKGNDSALARWREPVVKDNSGEIISPEQRVPFPLTQGQRAKAGIYTLVYGAQDSAGNKARGCVISVVIQELRCPRHYATPFLHVLCPTGSRYGSSCYFSCDTGFRLNGSDSSECVISDTSPSYALWEWSHGSRPECVPSDTCPPLTPPVNGAVVRDTWEDGDFAKLQCRAGTDIPRDFRFTPVARLLVCFRNPDQPPRWNYDGPLPDCTPVTAAEGLVMDAVLSYFSGQCFNETVRLQIRDNFITYLTTKSFFYEVCLNNTACRVENVDVTCGPTRQRRSSGQGADPGTSTTIQAPFQVTFTLRFRTEASGSMDPEQEFVTSALALTSLRAELSRDLGDLLNESAYDTLPQSQLQVQASPPQLLCPPGTLPARSAVTCVECPKGTYHDEATKSCPPCPKDHYQNQTGQRECVSCPERTSTLYAGATSLDLCQKLCPPGQTSTTGIVPCSPCARGTYQHLHGQTSCLSCPLSTATLVEGASSRSQCQDFDLIFPKDANASVTLDVLNLSPLELPLTLATWFRRDMEGEAPVVRLTFEEHEILVELGSNHTLAVSVDGNILLKLNDVTSAHWHHLVVKMQNDVISAFLTRTQLNASARIEIPLQNLINSSSFSISIGGEGFAGSVSQLNVWSGRGVAPPPSPTPLCQQPPGGGGDVVSWRAWLQARDRGAMVQLPSLCDDIDECDSNPCVHGACADDFHDFRCTCDPGFTGKACDVNMDDCQAHLCNHNATCVDGVASYSCACPPDYTGFFCDDVVTAGSWSPWSDWSACSVSCGRGEHSRVRRCDSPPPQNGGLPCQGNATELESCNGGACPECPSLETPRHGWLDCREGRGLRRCRLLCEDGYDLDVEPLPVYTCGLQSGYVWNHQTPTNPSARLPSCLEKVPAKEVRVTYNATYRNLTCNSRALASKANVHIMKVLRDVTESLKCARNVRCRVDLEVTNCPTDDVRDASMETKAGISITVSNNPSQVGTQTGIEDTMAAMLYINASSYHGNFIVYLEGETFDLDLPTGKFSGSVLCSPGFVKVDYTCVPCGPGSFWKDGVCHWCHVGSFQPALSQNSCTLCPPGSSTSGEAAVSADQCTADISQPALPLHVMLPPTIGGVVGLLVVVGIVVAVFLRRTRASQEQPEKTPVLDYVQRGRRYHNIFFTSESRC